MQIRTGRIKLYILRARKVWGDEAYGEIQYYRFDHVQNMVGTTRGYQLISHPYIYIYIEREREIMQKINGSPHPPVPNLSKPTYSSIVRCEKYKAARTTAKICKRDNYACKPTRTFLRIEKNTHTHSKKRVELKEKRKRGTNYERTGLRSGKMEQKRNGKI